MTESLIIVLLHPLIHTGSAPHERAFISPILLLLDFQRALSARRKSLLLRSSSRSKTQIRLLYLPFKPIPRPARSFVFRLYIICEKRSMNNEKAGGILTTTPP